MCGIAGFLSHSIRDEAALRATARRMADALEQRGPDDAGAWADAASGIAFGHRRLSIIDLSEHGRQPMESACGRFVLTYNGEIYNFQDLREELVSRGHAFRGHSDTEVILAAVREWGVAGAIPRLNGMFAMGIWDKAERALYLVRDRIGEKPLSYGWAGSNFLFASDLRAIERHPAFTASIDRDSVTRFLRFGYVPAPHSIYDGFFKLPPGCLLRLEHADAHRPSNFSPNPESSALSRPVRYWSARTAVLNGLNHPFAGSEDDAAGQLDTLLRDAVLRRMTADVPLGTLLSGGVDSSLIAALMQAQSSQPIKTFTIGFLEKGFNEAGHAGEVARHLRTDHVELYLDGNDALDIIDRLPSIYDEPFADASQIPSTLLSGLVRKHVTVALSGDGGDELFGGYNRYLLGPSIWKRVGWMPPAIRRAGERVLRTPTTDQWDRLGRQFTPLLKNYGTYGTAGDKFHKLADVLAMETPDALYERLVTVWTDPSSVVRGLRAAHEPLAALAKGIPTSNLASRMMWLDLLTYLPDDILVKVDRASMGSSLEVRVPLLDHRLVEFAWSLPQQMKISGGVSKRLLRRVLYRYVPQSLIERPKMGFGVPISTWLRGPLREWAESLLNEQSLEKGGLLNPSPIRAHWEEHVTGRRSWEQPLWAVLMLQAWLRNRDGQPRAVHETIPEGITGKPVPAVSARRLEPRVLAVVVTHNRLELLKRCLQHLGVQTRLPDETLVVNNGSTDGTSEFLLENGINHVTQPNGGSSVGWRRGIQHALDHAFDFVWLMDDDGYPDSEALKSLVAAVQPQHACLSSMVVKQEDPHELVFALPRLTREGFPRLIALPRKYYRAGDLRKKVAGQLYPFAHLFNGALVSIDAIRRIGNIDTSFFAYGEELDYLWRLKRVGEVATHTGALQLHPDVSRRPLRPTTPYYFVRNSFILSRRYLNVPRVRRVLAVGIVMARLHHRNGARTFWRYALGPDRKYLSAAIRDGLAGRTGPFVEN